jgi:transposase InsO family protein
MSIVLDDYSRNIIAWKLCSTMKPKDVLDTLQLTFDAFGCEQPSDQHRPRLLSDNRSSYVSTNLAE